MRTYTHTMGMAVSSCDLFVSMECASVANRETDAYVVVVTQSRV